MVWVLLFLLFYTSCSTSEDKFTVLYDTLSRVSQHYSDKSVFRECYKKKIVRLIDIFIDTFWNENEFLVDEKLLNYLQYIDFKNITLKSIEDFAPFFLVYMLQKLTDFENYSLEYTDLIILEADEVFKEIYGKTMFLSREKDFVKQIIKKIVQIMFDFTNYKNKYRYVQIWNTNKEYNLFFNFYKILKNQKNFESLCLQKSVFIDISEIYKDLTNNNQNFVLISSYKSLDTKIIEENRSSRTILFKDIIKNKEIRFFSNMSEQVIVTNAKNKPFLVYMYLFIGKLISELSFECVEFKILNSSYFEDSVYMRFLPFDKVDLEQKDKQLIEGEIDKAKKKSYLTYLVELLDVKEKIKKIELKILTPYNDTIALIICKTFSEISARNSFHWFSNVINQLLLKKSEISENQIFSENFKIEFNELSKCNSDSFKQECGKLFHFKGLLIEKFLKFPKNIEFDLSTKLDKDSILSLITGEFKDEISIQLVYKSIYFLNLYNKKISTYQDEMLSKQFNSLIRKKIFLEETLISIKKISKDLPCCKFNLIDQTMLDTNKSFKSNLKFYCKIKNKNKELEEDVEKKCKVADEILKYYNLNFTTLITRSENELKLSLLAKLIKHYDSIDDDEVYNEVFYATISDQKFSIDCNEEDITNFLTKMKYKVGNQILLLRIFKEQIYWTFLNSLQK